MCKGGITRLKLHLAHIPKCNVKKCEKVPADAKTEMIELLAKKNTIKENKTKERKRARDEVNLDHSEGEASGEEDGGNSVVVVHSGRAESASSSKGSASPLQKKLLLQRREQALAIRCRPSCQLRKEKRGKIEPVSTSANSFMKLALHTI